ncbi:MAG: phosphate ABC transporter permease subunit PstC [Robiginitomaculum sp.]
MGRPVDLKLRHARRSTQIKEFVIQFFLIASSLVAILTTIGIVVSLAFEAFKFFEKIPISDFLFGLKWSPQTAIRADQVGASGAFGVIPLLTGTLLISFIAMTVATPLGLLSAVYLAEYAQPKTRTLVKPLLELLAGIPTVVYGFFAALVIAPIIRNTGSGMGFEISSESALAAGLVMGIMLVPFISSLSDDVINAVPQTMRDASFGLGATHAETITKVVLPAATPGIMSSLLLAISRAIGETMIVVMAAGLAAKLSLNPLEAVTTMTVQIVTLLTGDQEFDSAKTLAAFAIALFLFTLTLGLNIVALKIVDKYKKQYD